MSRLLPSYLHTLRKQWGLSQPELAALLDISPSGVSRLENLSRRPTAHIIVASEVIFGHGVKELFPGFYHATQHKIVERSRALYQELEAQSDAASREKLRLLIELYERADSSAKPI
jgi:transcriptional regulator with XRE-family HTH domain